MSNWRQEVVDHVILPVAHLSIAFNFGFCVLDVVDIKPCIILEVSESHFIEFLCE